MPVHNAEFQCRALLLGIRTGEDDGCWRHWWSQASLVAAGNTNGGCKPPASYPSQPAPNTSEVGWVATGCDVNQVVTILKRCAANSIKWAS
jgi:hypothetical protein